MNNQEAAEALGNLTIPQLVALTKQLEQLWGVEAKPQAIQVEQVKTQKSEEQTEFTLTLLPVSAAAKMNTIKTIRDILKLPLKDAKEFVEGAPKMVQEGLTKEQANLISAQLKDCGAEVELK